LAQFGSLSLLLLAETFSDLASRIYSTEPPLFFQVLP
jgi:hypothetical protein